MEQKQTISALKAVKTVALLNPESPKSVVDIRIMRYVQQSNYQERNHQIELHHEIATVSRMRQKRQRG